jgi:hypothetical protein
MRMISYLSLINTPDQPNTDNPPTKKAKVPQPPDFTKFMSISEQNEAIISHVLELVESGYNFD